MSQFLVYNGYTQMFALFEDRAEAQKFHDHYSNCGHLMAVVPVSSFPNAEIAIRDAKPLEVPKAAPSYSPGEKVVPMRSRADNKNAASMRGLDFASVVDELAEGE